MCIIVDSCDKCFVMFQRLNHRHIHRILHCGRLLRVDLRTVNGVADPVLAPPRRRLLDRLRDYRDNSSQHSTSLNLKLCLVNRDSVIMADVQKHNRYKDCLSDQCQLTMFCRLA